MVDPFTVRCFGTKPATWVDRSSTVGATRQSIMIYSILFYFTPWTRTSWRSPNVVGKAVEHPLSHATLVVGAHLPIQISWQVFGRLGVLFTISMQFVYCFISDGWWSMQHASLWGERHHCGSCATFSLMFSLATFGGWCITLRISSSRSQFSLDLWPYIGIKGIWSIKPQCLQHFVGLEDLQDVAA